MPDEPMTFPLPSPIHILLHANTPISKAVIARARDSLLEANRAMAVIIDFIDPSTNPRLRASNALQFFHRHHPDVDLLLLDATAEHHDQALQRLLDLAHRHDTSVLSAMDNRNPMLSPQREGESATMPSVNDVDRACVALHHKPIAASAEWSDVLCFWRSAAIALFQSGFEKDSLPNELSAHTSGHVALSVFVGIKELPFLGPPIANDPRFARAAHPLDVLRADLPRVWQYSWPAIGIDQKPVVLHILHGWGGGAERFVDDLAFADGERHHLVLTANNITQKHRHGEQLELRIANRSDLPTLRRWPLPVPIGSIASENHDYQRVLNWCLGRYNVAQIIISSLIGHALDALKTKIPTRIVCHDYFPLWPELHRDFGDVTSDFSESGLEHFKPGSKSPFREHARGFWQSIRRQFVDTVIANDIHLVAPSQCVIDNWRRIEPRFRDRTFTCIPHAIRHFESYREHIKKAHDEASAPIGKLRVLVPGRVNGGKGKDLLTDLLPLLDTNIELYLLGCGSAGMGFFGRNRVHVVLNYERNELPSLLEQIKPDLALLPSSVSETFSYTLSELAALSVPTMATRLGSFVERIRDGETGILVDPNAISIANRLNALVFDSCELNRIQSQCFALAHLDLDAFAKAHRDQFSPLEEHEAHGVQVNREPQADPIDLISAAQNLELQHLQIRNAALQQQINDQELELTRRGEWGFRLDAVIKQNATEYESRKLQWNQLLSQTNEELAQTRTILNETQKDLQESSQSLNDMQSALTDVQAALAEAQTKIELQHTSLVTMQRELDERTDWALTLDKEVQDIRNSFFWRLTSPLRRTVDFVRRVKSTVRFKASHVQSLLVRGLRSLRVRGLKGTLIRWQHFRQGGLQPTSAMLVQPPTESPTQNAIEAGLLSVPCNVSPAISIIIPVYNQFHYTLACLKSIAENPGINTFEVIVVDDCSSDATTTELQKIDGVRIERNAENLGFIGACNRGAALARGDYLVFLNNDTQVQSNWLDALFATFAQHHEVGLVGAKLIYPDGRLQEAGGIVFADGSGWNYGRFDDPRDPRYNFVREVDYCSGAAIMIARDLFLEFGGFDALYKPAYYEDTDLAFKVRAKGLRVLLQPRSEVIHFEGITSGTDTSSGTKRYQVVNQEKFLARWHEVLKSHPTPPPQTPIELAREHRRHKRILICDACTPTPDQDSGSVRMVNLMRALIDLNWKVCFLNENRMHDGKYTEAIQSLGVEAWYAPFVQDPVQYMRTHGPLFDAVLLSRHYIATPLLPVVREYAPQAKVIFDTVDLHYLREERAANIEQRSDLLRQAAATKNQELRLMRSSDVTLVVSPVEAQLLAQEVPNARVEILSNVHEVAGVGKPFDQRRDFFFIGGFQHQPNVDAVLWFMKDIWPLLESRLPEATFHIVGSQMPSEISALTSARVIAHGFLEDINWLLDDCRLSIAPLRYGAGVKGKVNMSMAHGQPVVATPMAIEGMHAEDGEDVLIGETAAQFADAVVRLYTDADLWKKISINARHNVEQHFSFDAAKKQLLKILN